MLPMERRDDSAVSLCLRKDQVGTDHQPLVIKRVDSPISLDVDKRAMRVFSEALRWQQEIFSSSVEDILTMELTSLDGGTNADYATSSESDDPFYVGDLHAVIRQHHIWQMLLPNIETFYAVKCNPDVNVIRVLEALGTGFDVASRNEISLLKGLGVHPSRLIYANPCKQASHLEFAKQSNVDLMTFDNEDELKKIKTVYPEAKLVIRILADDSRSLCKLGLKYGVPPERAKAVLQVAKNLHLEVVGVSFHVGSGCFDASAFEDAVKIAHDVAQDMIAMGFDFQLLDVGGGFPGGKEQLREDLSVPKHQPGVTFNAIAKTLSTAIQTYFYGDVQYGDKVRGSFSRKRLRIIAEPGRFYVSNAFTLATQIHARRVIESNGKDSLHHMYYIPDGVYGGFNCIMFDHATVIPRVLSCSASPDEILPCFNHEGDNEMAISANCRPVIGRGQGQTVPCSIWGPTCDSMDLIVRNVTHLPSLDVGDWLVWENMGAYTMAAGSTFNGYQGGKVIYTFSGGN